MNNFGGNNYDWRGPSQQQQTINSSPNTQQIYRNTQVTGLNQNGLSYIPLQGHAVQSEQDILPKDVPMDGSAGWFPAQNLQYVIMRRWNNQGMFDTILYVPYQPEQENNQVSTEQSASLNEFMAQINARFDKLEKAVARKPYYPRNNKPKEESK